MKKVAAYYRCSTEGQENSISMQRDRAIEYCTGKFLMIDKEYKDEFVSARKNKMEDRPALWRLFRDIQDGTISDLVVYKRDRLARNVSEHMRLYDILRKRDVAVHFTDDGNLYPMKYDPTGEYLEIIFAALSEHEGHQIAARISQVHLSNFYKGKWGGTLSQQNSKESIEVLQKRINIVQRDLEVLDRRQQKLQEFKSWIKQTQVTLDYQNKVQHLEPIERRNLLQDIVAEVWICTGAKNGHVSSMIVESVVLKHPYLIRERTSPSGVN